jgi:hypothetical protein
MAELRAATTLDQFLSAGHREVPFLTVVAEGEVHVVGLDSDRSAVTEVPGVTKRAAIRALFERHLTYAR